MALVSLFFFFLHLHSLGWLYWMLAQVKVYSIYIHNLCINEPQLLPGIHFLSYNFLPTKSLCTAQYGLLLPSSFRVLLQVGSLDFSIALSMNLWQMPPEWKTDTKGRQPCLEFNAGEGRLYDPNVPCSRGRLINYQATVQSNIKGKTHASQSITSGN